MTKEDFKNEMQETIGIILKEHKHKIVALSPHSVWYIKRCSNKLGFYINCFGSRDRKAAGIKVEFYLTGINRVDDSISTFGLGLKIPITSVLPVQEKDESNRVVIRTDFRVSDEQMIGAAKKIIDIEERLSEDIKDMILEEAYTPYFSNNRLKIYRDKLQMYDTLNEDLKWKEEFELLKKDCYKNYKSPKVFNFCNDFVEKLPSDYFKEKNILFQFDYHCLYETEFQYVKNQLCEYLCAQCLFGKVSKDELF